MVIYAMIQCCLLIGPDEICGKLQTEVSLLMLTTFSFQLGINNSLNIVFPVLKAAQAEKNTL